MPGPIVRAIMRGVTPALAALLVGCGELPDHIPPPVRTIVTIRVTGCAAVAITESCDMTAQAWDGEGNVIQNPPLVWSSSEPGIASVTGSGSSATVTGLRAGRTVISAGTGDQRTSDSVSLSVAPRKQGE